MNLNVPRKIFFTKGVGTHKEELHSFELALRDAGIEKCNLVQVSSILPPGCKVISRTQGVKQLQPGAITYCVMSRAAAAATNPTACWPHRWALPFPRTKKHTVISASTTLSAELRRKPVIMRKTWPPRCWHQRWASTLILMKAGTRKKKYSKSAARLSARGISRNQPLLKTTGSRRSWPPQSLFSRPAAA